MLPPTEMLRISSFKPSIVDTTHPNSHLTVWFVQLSFLRKLVYGVKEWSFTHLSFSVILSHVSLHLIPLHLIPRCVGSFHKIIFYEIFLPKIWHRFSHACCNVYIFRKKSGSIKWFCEFWSIDNMRISQIPSVDL